MRSEIGFGLLVIALSGFTSCASVEAGSRRRPPEAEPRSSRDEGPQRFGSLEWHVVLSEPPPIVFLGDLALPDAERAGIIECYLGCPSELMAPEPEESPRLLPEPSRRTLTCEQLIEWLGDLEATVADRAGQPLRRAAVVIEPMTFDLDALELRPSEGADATLRSAEAVTDALGRFAESLYEGWYRVRVQTDAGSFAAGTVFVRANATRKLRIRQP